ncbi:class I and II aminotransferase [Bacillus thuringiensis HD-771]|uniref:Class I and II aminotransferase n=1 Tax=Bacillus thuringiensis HD-771 TaxID=1218175 RepID=A0A9W3JDQ9_BACTU|nr:class I and II aminotransferase [Bacillus thuringiensis HD-771]
MQLFHKAINRRGTHSIKWDTYKNEELIHAWIGLLIWILKYQNQFKLP